ncbi:MAG TPA: amidohydrolase family protein [Anaeromyxobacteraceae bacterium]|nr:amidohydrolase family protein [Anaeromyxobacteraceae bacterium]
MRTGGTAAIEYVRSYLDAGLSWLEVLRVLTTNAARLTGLERERGALAAGVAADLVVLDGDPRAEPEVLMRVAAVFKDGRRVVREAP